MYRTVDTRTWDDPKVKSLPIPTKLLFLYLITNRYTHISGLYYLPLAVIKHELSIGEKIILLGFEQLGALEMVYRDAKNDIVWVVNMIRYQAQGPKAIRAVQIQLKSIHQTPLIHKFITRYPEFKACISIPNGYPIDTLGGSVTVSETETETVTGTEIHIARSDSDKAESSKPDSEETIVATLLLADKTEYGIRESQATKMAELYPGVSLDREFAKMAGWCLANPTKRKTRKGIFRFINAWLAKAQDNSTANKLNGSGYAPRDEIHGQFERLRAENARKS